jgi:predicted CopG family antitoxin
VKDGLGPTKSQTFPKKLMLKATSITALDTTILVFGKRSFGDFIERLQVEKNEILEKILHEEDYIRCPKFSNSINKFTEKNSEGAENATIARLLMMTEEEVERVYQEAVQMLREEMEDE